MRGRLKIDGSPGTTKIGSEETAPTISDCLIVGDALPVGYWQTSIRFMFTVRGCVDFVAITSEDLGADLRCYSYDNSATIEIPAGLPVGEYPIQIFAGGAVETCTLCVTEPVLIGDFDPVRSRGAKDSGAFTECTDENQPLTIAFPFVPSSLTVNGVNALPLVTAITVGGVAYYQYQSPASYCRKCWFVEFAE